MEEKTTNAALASLFPPGLKKTNARLLVLSVLKESDVPLTANEIHAKLVKAGESASLSTVYRILETFVEHNLLSKTVYADDATAYYAFLHSAQDEMNSVVCLSCKKRFFLKGAVIDEQSLEKRMDGFHITAHKMELYGYCKECSDKKHAHDEKRG